MIEINWAASGVIITLLTGLIGLAAWVGAINEKVKQHKQLIMENKNEVKEDREQNRQDHRLIFDKLDNLRDLVKNGH